MSMRVYIAIAVAVFVASTPIPASAQYTTAGSLYEACVAVDETRQAVCRSYIAGATDAIIMTGVLGCEPSDYDAEAIRRAAMVELAKPDRAENTALAAIFEAVADTFPCTPLDQNP